MSKRDQELSHYRGKMKKYKNEILELREMLATIESKYVRVCKEKERYKVKITEAKGSIARFNQIVDDKSRMKSDGVKRELERVKEELGMTKSKLNVKTEENQKLRNQLKEQDEYVHELEARVEELLEKDNEETKL